MRDYLSLGATPAEEPCAQVGRDDYQQLYRAECNRYIAQLRRMFGKEPKGAKLAIKAFPHDFGTYHEVVCYFEGPEAQDYAFKLENNLPSRWDNG